MSNAIKDRKINKKIKLFQALPAIQKHILRFHIIYSFDAHTISKLLCMREIEVQHQLSLAKKLLKPCFKKRWKRSIQYSLEQEDPYWSSIYSTLSKIIRIMQKQFHQELSDNNAKNCKNKAASIFKKKNTNEGKFILETEECDECQQIEAIYHNLTKVQKHIFVLFEYFKFDIHIIRQLLNKNSFFISKEIKKIKTQLKNTNSSLWFEVIMPKLKDEYYGDHSWYHLFIDFNVLLIAFGKDINYHLIHSNNKNSLKSFVFSFACKRIALAIGFFIISSNALAKGIDTIVLKMIESGKFATVTVNVESEGTNLKVVETLFFPEYLPEGYELVEQVGKINQDRRISIIYSCNNDSSIIFEYYLKEITRDIDNEDLYRQQLKIKNLDATYQEDSNIRYLLWSDNKYIFKLRGNNQKLTKEEMKK